MRGEEKSDKSRRHKQVVKLPPFKVKKLIKNIGWHRKTN